MAESTVVALRLPRELVELVDEHADRERRTRSNMMRFMIEDWLMDRAGATHNRLVDTRKLYETGALSRD